jgi:hypothetical protein
MKVNMEGKCSKLFKIGLNKKCICIKFSHCLFGKGLKMLIFKSFEKT